MPGMVYDPPFHKTTYSGKYRQSDDTCYISYLIAYTEVKDRNKTVERYTIPADIPFLISNSVFFIRNGVVASQGLLFPALPRASAPEVRAFEMKFQTWNNQINQDVLGKMKRLRELLFPIPRFKIW